MRSATPWRCSYDVFDRAFDEFNMGPSSWEYNGSEHLFAKCRIEKVVWKNFREPAATGADRRSPRPRTSLDASIMPIEPPPPDGTVENPSPNFGRRCRLRLVAWRGQGAVAQLLGSSPSYRLRAGPIRRRGAAVWSERPSTDGRPLRTRVGRAPNRARNSAATSGQHRNPTIVAEVLPDIAPEFHPVPSSLRRFGLPLGAAGGGVCGGRRR